MSSIDGCSGSGKVTLALDFRTDEPGKVTRSAYWNRIEDVAAFVTLLGELCGADTQVFFEFGVVTIKNVDLTALAERVRTAAKEG